MNDGLLIAIIGAALAAILPESAPRSAWEEGRLPASCPETGTFVRLLILQALRERKGFTVLTAVILIHRLGPWRKRAGVTTGQGWLF